MDSHVTTACEHCGTVKVRPRHVVVNGGGRFCSRKCANAAHKRDGRDNPNWRGGRPKSCVVCGAEFWVKPSHWEKRRACSRACLTRLHRESGRFAGSNNPVYGKSWRLENGRAVASRPQKVALVCSWCGSGFERLHRTHRQMAEDGRKPFCSRTCSCRAAAARPISGPLNPNYGNGQAIEGTRNPNWKGGLSFEPYTAEFTPRLKRAIRERDGHVCQLCGGTRPQRRRVLHVHHIDYDKANCSEANLITLCGGCNARVNFTRGWWTLYFQALLAARAAPVS